MNFQQEHPAGVYEIVNVLNQKRYIGSSVSIDKRLANHLYSLRKGSHHNSYLQRAWDKYGEGAFYFGIVEIVPDTKWLLEEEQYWIDAHLSADRRFGYNISPIAGGTLGIKHSAEAIEKTAAANRGKKRSPEAIEKSAAGHRGKKRSPEAIEKTAAANRGKTRSAETRATMSEAKKGKTPSEETRQKLSAAKKGENHPLFGKTPSEETRQKQSEAQKGKPWSANRRLAQQRRFNERLIEEGHV